METFHRELQTGHTAAIFEGTPAIMCNGLRCFQKLKITGKWPISLQDLAGPLVRYGINSKARMPLSGHQRVGNLSPSLPTFYIHALLVLLVPRKPILAQREISPKPAKEKKKARIILID